MTSHRSAFRGLVALAAALALAVVAGCGGSDSEPESTTAEPAAGEVSGSVSILGPWTRDQQKSFEAVLDGFRDTQPKVDVKYTSAGDSTVTVLGTAVAGGNPPDIAVIPQPGLVRDFQAQGALEPLDFAKDVIADNFPASLIDLGTIDGKLYSLMFKAANKSTVWYNVGAFEAAGVTPPETFEQLREVAATITASGLPAYSVGGADGWTLTDLFENIYLRQAGPEKYDQLAVHEIPWTDASVKSALTTMAEVLGDDATIAGGRSRALQTDFATSAESVFSDPPKAAMIIEGDFVPAAVAGKTELEPGTGYGVFPFPSVDGSGAMVVGGGDSLVTFKQTPASKALIEYLATPEAAAIWARRGGFSSPNENVSPDVYPDDISRRIATAIAEAETFRFDMSDLAPAKFGGTPGQGEFKLLQDLLAEPDSVDETAAALEAAAAKAFK